MRKLLVTLTFVMTVMAAFAVPAKQGLWQTLRLADGTEISAQLMGDEHLHFYQTADGQRYVINEDGTARPADMEQMRLTAAMRRAHTGSARRLRSPRRVEMGERTSYTGQKKGIVILMQFTDKKFKTGNNNAKYNDILNKENYVTGSFKGSVADYFKAQSNGIFELTFDVVGPYTAKYSVSHYGSNDNQGNDKLPDDLIVEAVKAADSEVDFKDYDWDGDGEVDQVFVLYAGTGEADGGSSSTIWPHMWFLSETNKSLTLDGVKIDTYACSNEVTTSGNIEGIGCFCHEFSHCLGYPDFYDTSYSGWFGMSKFDLMDQGSYNGNSFQPSGYTAYEKWMAGWLEPKVLGSENVTVENLVATSDNGDAYIMYNDAHQDEYYMIENRQKTGWDASIPSRGLMITHVDFDKEIWNQNTPNTKITQQDIWSSGGELTKTNDHQRCTIFHADNQDDAQYWSSYGGYYTMQTLEYDLYPYSNNDSLTATSKPAATLFNKNSRGTKVMQGALLKIKQNTDKTINFVYRAKEGNDTTTTPVIPDVPGDTIMAKGDTLFYESFDKCAGTGGNDGNWNTTIAQSSSKFATDNSGWEYLAAYGGYKCARFGNGSKLGTATTPLFTIDGEAILTFRASGWNTDGTELSISLVENSDVTATITPTQVVMKNFEWTEYNAVITGKGVVRISFSPVKRFLLDEVLVRSVGVEPAIEGDVNGDGTVDVADIATVISVMAAVGADPVSASNADINGDGVVDVADIATVISIMAGAGTAASNN